MRSPCAVAGLAKQINITKSRFLPVAQKSLVAIQVPYLPLAAVDMVYF